MPRFSNEKPKLGHYQSGLTRTLPSRFLAALVAGSIALAANMALLWIAGVARINTGKGGLLRLFAMMIQRLAGSFRLLDGLRNLQMPSLAIFHIVTGLAMAVAYVMIEPRLPGRPFSKGLVYGTVVWCFNAFLVLPLIGEGIAGSRNVNTVGLIVFAVAHMTFFLALSMLYGALAFLVFTVAGLLADEHHARLGSVAIGNRRVHFAEDRLGCVAIEVASMAALDSTAQYR